jgi:hypothetical protein
MPCARSVPEVLPEGVYKNRKGRGLTGGVLWFLSVGSGSFGGLNAPHNPKVAGSNPAPASKKAKGLGETS